MHFDKMQLFSVLLLSSLSSFGVAAPTGIDNKSCGSKNSTLGLNQDLELVVDPKPEAPNPADDAAEECWAKTKASVLSCQKLGKSDRECSTAEAAEELGACLQASESEASESEASKEPKPEAPNPADDAAEECWAKTKASVLSCQKLGKSDRECLTAKAAEELGACLQASESEASESEVSKEPKPEAPERPESTKSPKLEDEPITDGLGLLDPREVSDDPKLGAREPAGQSRGL
ncbi:hypothetical protein BM221_007260 [Beauveria bassiana]|uniref:Uncharacterized protein n=1 Tax=Beauveria bassiana TaxID=176275 RepID=A0A2N6NJW6_BEABA|nr:hypothetical protein BM221_007251 [Beauveria bassiana]PMB67590.1 hypothetical protein BM221_007260 [Beauveria bassiana]